MPPTINKLSNFDRRQGIRYLRLIIEGTTYFLRNRNNYTQRACDTLREGRHEALDLLDMLVIDEQETPTVDLAVGTLPQSDEDIPF